MFITAVAFRLYYVNYLYFISCLNSMFPLLCFFQGRCYRILQYFLSLFLFLCCISFVGIVIGNIHCMGPVGCYTSVIALNFGTTCSASALDVPSAIAASCTTRRDRLITSDMGAVSVTSVSSPSRDTLAWILL
jgi:hypothetical protein